ncbi:MAG: replicative DNA helicase, partial [Candidatus Omnitrophica bacterium]|nr:replicative DNA helicase [Candidatus Omnitrophota bacterium]
MAQELLEKIPPQNIDAEMAILGAMLLNEEAISVASEMLTQDSFYKDSHRRIFDAIMTLFEANKAVDLITLSDELKNRGILDGIGGASYLTGLVNSVPTAANIGHYVSIVKERSILRTLITNATKIVQLCYESEGDIDSVVDSAERFIFEVSDRRIHTNYTSLKELVKDSIETIDNLYQKKAHVTGVPTGFIDFDIKTAGLQPSDLIVVAGRPSMGKSALALCIAEYAGIIEKIPTAIFSLEMSKEQLVQRMLCAHARVDAHKVRTGYLATSDWPRLTAAAGKLSEASIFIDDSPGISVMELRAKARRLKSHHDIQLLILDYMQLMRGSASSES